jgi:hypothetical protein
MVMVIVPVPGPITIARLLPPSPLPPPLLLLLLLLLLLRGSTSPLCAAALPASPTPRPLLLVVVVVLIIILVSLHPPIAAAAAPPAAAPSTMACKLLELLVLVLLLLVLFLLAAQQVEGLALRIFGTLEAPRRRLGLAPCNGLGAFRAGKILLEGRDGVLQVPVGGVGFFDLFPHALELVLCLPQLVLETLVHPRLLVDGLAEMVHVLPRLQLLRLHPLQEAHVVVEVLLEVFLLLGDHAQVFARRIARGGNGGGRGRGGGGRGSRHGRGGRRVVRATPRNAFHGKELLVLIAEAFLEELHLVA